MQANPFRNRICRVFSTAENGEDGLSFEDFLDLLSVFSDSATPEIKSHYAFRLFGRARSSRAGRGTTVLPHKQGPFEGFSLGWLWER